ncbi:hypothetical protein [Roseateles sp. LKC17W]|jgi:hypothetical protein|uniref:Uncharacterized protein n=1 Tax=Pelomonas margarita TaxID=3299031 RepID=A0ABW7FFI6_9BURK
MQEKKLSDGTWIIASDSVNIHSTHLHLAPDGTILSHKVNGNHSYKLSNSRRDLSSLWEEITGERNKFPGGWKP